MIPILTPRVRFAPSPTGYLHVGGARTALFNWLVFMFVDGMASACPGMGAIPPLPATLRFLGLSSWNLFCLAQPLHHPILPQGGHHLKQARSHGLPGERNPGPIDENPRLHSALICKRP